MKLDRPQVSPADVRAQSEAWFANQLEILARCHGRDWPKYEAWFTECLKAELRERLIAVGWRPKR